MDESCSSKDTKEPKKVITYDINNIGGNSGYIGQNFDKRWTKYYQLGVKMFWGEEFITFYLIWNL